MKVTYTPRRCFYTFLASFFVYKGENNMNQTKKITLSALFIALGLVLPFVTMQIPAIGSMLLPMHIPVLICGFVLSCKYGLLVGVITPLLRHLIFGMPPLLTAITMAFELGAYGFFSGMLYRKLKKNIYLSLILSMLVGRVVWGIASAAIYGISEFGVSAFIAGGFVNAVPGIILQLILIPILVKVLKQGGYISE